MKSKLITGMITLSLLFILPFSTFANGFKDISGHWAEEELVEAVNRGIMNGYSDGRVGPNDSVTRGQFAAFLVRAMSLTEGSIQTSFSDVNSETLLSDDIYIAASNGLITGYVDGTFKPGEKISRLSMAIMMDRALQFKGLPQRGKELHFIDKNEINLNYQAAVANAVHYEVINGIADGNNFKFSPKANASRAQGVTVILRLLEAEDKSDDEVVEDIKDEDQIEEENAQAYYSITLPMALDMQMQANPQTDKYRNSPAYVSKDHVELGKRGQTYSLAAVNIRLAPNLTAEIVEQVPNKTDLIITGTVEGDSFNGSTEWYSIIYKDIESYIHSSLVKIREVAVVTADVLNVRSQPSDTSHIYGKFRKGTELEVLSHHDSWIEVPFTTWRSATRSDVQYYLDPTAFINDDRQRFQFLDLSKTTGTSVAAINGYLSGKGILDGKAEAFIYAGRTQGVNEVYLISHAILETGNGGSQLAQGVEVGLNSENQAVQVTEENRDNLTNIKKVYNMFGIGAYDSCPVQCGSKRAYELDWDTPVKAIIGGAQFISKDYVQAGQNTLYKMRWNPDAMVEKGEASHQYATDIGWAAKQINSMYNLYKEIGIQNVYLEIPVYKK